MSVGKLTSHTKSAIKILNRVKNSVFALHWQNNGFCLDELSRGERLYRKSRKIDKKIPENGNSYNPCSGHGRFTVIIERFTVYSDL